MKTETWETAKYYSIKGMNAGKVVTNKHMEGGWSYNMAPQHRYLGVQILEEENYEELRCLSVSSDF